jgi:conjugal transfer mating pair stabilization protein TraN
VSRARLSCAIALSLFTAGLGSGALGQSQTGTEAARADGKAFGGEVLGKAQTAAKTQPTADRVPGFVGTPSQSTLFDDPDAIARQAATAASSNDGYATVRSSLDSRPQVAVEDIEATIARGRTISDDPTSYVSGMSVGGGQGSCRELPPSSGNTGTYEATCNEGVALEQRTASCTIPLSVTVTRTTGYRYWCSDFNAGFNRVDDCSLFEQTSCQRTGSHEGRCLQGRNRPPYEWCTEPGEPVHELLCDAEVAGGTLRGTETNSSVSERRDESGCASLAGDANCASTDETCTSSDPVTRVIDGVSVTKPCWAWTRSYECHRAVPAQDCGTLENDSNCRFAREECLTDEVPCPTRERIYVCTVPGGPAPKKQYVCDADIYCINGECETIDRQPNTEFKDAAVALNAASQAGKEFDPANLTLFKGERETCHSKVFGILNCCAGKAFPLIPYSQLLVALGCNREEVLLHQRDAQGLCHYVGSYCSDSVFGICVTKKKAYCCFESKLSRILQEQGRAQINKPWGSPKRESCQGFTIDEFARLDLSRMDFFEVYAEFQDAAKLPEELGTVETMQRKIADFYAINGGDR